MLEGGKQMIENYDDLAFTYPKDPDVCFTVTKFPGVPSETVDDAPFWEKTDSDVGEYSDELTDYV